MISIQEGANPESVALQIHEKPLYLKKKEVIRGGIKNKLLVHP